MRVVGDQTAVAIRAVAEEPELLGAARELFCEYERSLGVDLCFQGFEAELAALPGAYAPPSGCLLVAHIGELAIGCVALRQLEPGTAELKRLYVRPQARRLGLGRELVAQVLEIARQLGYARVVLDTLPSMREAQRLYEGFGFRDVDAYNDNPLCGVRFMQIDVSPAEMRPEPPPG